MKTEEILNEREKTHGDFKIASETHYRAKALFRPVMEQNGTPVYRIEAVEAIIAKLNRIVHGNHDHADHWDDIAGYAMLGKGGERKNPSSCDKVSMKTPETSFRFHDDCDHIRFNGECNCNICDKKEGVDSGEYCCKCEKITLHRNSVCQSCNALL